MSDEPTYIDWLTTIEPEEVCEIASKYGNRYAEITEEQIEELRAGKVLCYVDEYGIFIRRIGRFRPTINPYRSSQVAVFLHRDAAALVFISKLYFFQRGIVT